MKISIDNHSYYNFKEIRGYINFMHHPSELLKNTVSIRPRACFSPSYNKVKSQTKHVWLLTLL